MSARARQAAERLSASVWSTPLRRRRFLVGAVALAALIFGTARVGAYGVTGDAPALFYAGDRTLFYLSHPSVPDAMNYNAAEPAAFHSTYDREQAVHNDPLWCPVMSALVAAVTSHVLHDWLGWMNVVDGHHMGLVLLHVIGLLLFGLYATRLLGLGPGLSAMIALALFPSALGHSFNNPKDWPCALYYGVAVLAAGVGVVEGRGWPLLVSGLCAGISLSGKANGVFVFATLLLWAPCAYWLLYRSVGRNRAGRRRRPGWRSPIWRPPSSFCSGRGCGSTRWPTTGAISATT